MFLKALTLSGGVLGAATLSQFPEFAQQYTQRLGGAVVELSRVVADYDADAAKIGLTRAEALVQQASGGEFGKMRAENMAATIRRQQSLQESLQVLQGASAFERAQSVLHFRDSSVARDTMQDYQPAVPITVEGAVFAGSGFVAGWLGVKLFFGAILGVFRALFGRRRRGLA